MTRCPLVTDVCRTERVCAYSGRRRLRVRSGVGRRLPSRRQGPRGLRSGRPESPATVPYMKEITVAAVSRRLPLGRRHRRPPERGRQHRPATPGSPSTSRRRCSASRPAGPATAGSCGARTSTWPPGWASTPTGSRSSGPASSRSRASSTGRGARPLRGDRRPTASSAGWRPVVTFNHFTSPHWFAARGGWLDAGGAGALRALLRPGDGRVRRPDRATRSRSTSRTCRGC